MNDAVRTLLDCVDRKGMSQLELAKLLGTNPPQVSRWLTGKHNPCRAWQYRIANVIKQVENPTVGKMKRLAHPVEQDEENEDND